MMKLNIINMESFLQTVNQCEGAVYLVSQDGQKRDINESYGIQAELLEKFAKNHRFLPITVEVPDSKDYMNIVCHYVVAC